MGDTEIGASAFEFSDNPFRSHTSQKQNLNSYSMSQDVETQNEITFSITDMVGLLECFKHANAQHAIIYARGKKE